MNCYSALVDVIDRLAIEINQRSTFSKELLSTGIATVGSVVAVLAFELIKEHFLTPRNEFKKLRRKVNSTLSMFACYYTNQIDLARASAKEVELYSSASKTMRELSVELMAFADDVASKKCCGIPVEDISEAAALLIGLSNSFFTPYDCPEMADNWENDRTRKKIRELLRITHKW